MKPIASIVFALCAALAAPAFAAGTDAFERPATEDQTWKDGKAAIAKQDWQAAVAAWRRAASKFNDNPDAHNWLGYSLRKSGDVDGAMRAYNTALRLDTRHKGAHEYIGEAYLMKKDVAGAERHLKALEGICGTGCEEYRDLQKSIAEFKSKN
jgi:Flp pilus assembly protein TadD